MKFKCDVMFRPRVISFGFQIGNNRRSNDKWKNIFLDVDIFWWSFGVELNW